MLLLGAVGAVAALRRPTLLKLFLIWDFAALARGLLLGERALHVARAASAAPAAAARRGSACSRSGTRAGAGPAGSASSSWCSASSRPGITSWWANVENGADPRRVPRHHAVGGPGPRRARPRVRGRRRGPSARAATSAILVDSAEGATYPWAWYFRDLPVGYLDLSRSTELPADTDVAILTEGNRARLLPDARGLRRHAASRSGSGGSATTGRCRRTAGGGGSPSASRGTRRAACGSGSTCARAPRARGAISHTVVPSASNTRSPSSSHFATPASP